MSESKRVSVSELVVLERDREIMREIDRWRVCQGRHIRELAGFGGQRACDRRLRKLMKAGYLSREKILYGVAGIYRLTNKGVKLEGLGRGRKAGIRIEQIRHDIAVLDTAIFLSEEREIKYKDMKTELELHRQDGFGKRQHRPDFIFKKDGKITCVEIELSLKSKSRFEAIIKDNFMAYDRQIWIVPGLDSKIARTLQKHTAIYPIEIITLNKIQGKTEENNNEQYNTNPLESGQKDFLI